MCSEQDTLSHFKRLQNEEVWFFHRKRLEPRVLQWQEQCHSVSFLMYISGAMFEEHCSNISGDSLDSVLCSLSGLFMTSTLSSFT